MYRGVFWIIEDELFAFPFIEGTSVGVSKSGVTYNHIGAVFSYLFRMEEIFRNRRNQILLLKSIVFLQNEALWEHDIKKINFVKNAQKIG